jgi:hypothetical protein
MSDKKADKPRPNDDENEQSSETVHKSGKGAVHKPAPDGTSEPLPPGSKG